MKSPIFRTKLTLGMLLLVAAGSFVHASDWTGGSGNWSSNASPGWNGTGVPNAIGAIANESQPVGTLVTITQDIPAGVTVGTINKGGAANHATTITGGSITLNQDGAGAGFATISNTNTNANGNNVTLNITSNLILADDLLITNTGNSTTGNSISLGGAISGAGNITISNISNSPAAAAVRFNNASDNTFTGTVTIQKGAVVVASSNPFGSNVVKLGQSGQGSATLQTAGARIFSNNIEVAANTLGTTLITSNVTTAVNTSFAGKTTLNGNLTIESLIASSGTMRFIGNVEGVGGITKIGTGELSLEGLNTYTGNTAISAGTLTLADNARLTFDIGANGVNNGITGAGAVNLNGDFVFNLTNAAATGSWNIVDVGSLTEVFGATFSVVGFTDAGNDLWTTISGGSLYTFSEATGLLTATVPEPSACAFLALGVTTILARRRRD